MDSTMGYNLLTSGLASVFKTKQTKQNSILVLFSFKIYVPSICFLILLHWLQSQRECIPSALTV